MTSTLIRPTQISGVPANGTIAPIMFSDGTEMSIANNAAEVTVWSGSIPGGILGTSKQLVFELWSALLNNNAGGGWTSTFRFKYGGTTLFSIAAPAPLSATPATQCLRVILRGDGSTSAQESQAQLLSHISGYIAGAFGTAAVNSTVSQPVSITCQLSAAHVNLTLTTKGLVVTGPI